MRKIVRNLLILILVFVAAVAAVLFLTRKKPSQVAYAVMENASLPIVTMELEGEPVNTLHGYTRPMDLSYMRDTVTPLPADRSLPFHISTYGETIEGVSYEVRSLGEGRLIEEGECEGLSGDSSRVDGLLGLQDLLEQGKEYALVLRVRTEKWESIEY